MLKFIHLIFISSFFVYSQSLLYNDPVISGTPLIPSKEVIQNYFDEMHDSDYATFQKLTSTHVIPQNVGDEYDFNVLNLKNPSSPKVEKKTFVLKFAGVQVDIWVEKAELENNHVTDAIILTIYNGLINNSPASSLDPSKGIYQIEKDVYGNPPDIDNNGKTEFLLTDIQDGWEDSGEYVGGFFYPNDQDVSFPGSNQADILYVDTYPGIFNGEVYNTYRALGTVAHELQHLIEYGYDHDESKWVNEGQSELASYLCGHGLRSPGLYLQNTNVSLTAWNDEKSLPHYSRVALWSYYLYEKYGLDLIGHITRNPSSGVNGINSALKDSHISDDFEMIVLDFFKTISLDNPQQNPQLAFNLPELQDLLIAPVTRIIHYPFQKELSIKALSMQLVQFSNGDSLSFRFKNLFFAPVYISRMGFGNGSFLEELNSEYLYDFEFGNSYHTLNMYFLNNRSSADLVEFNVDSKNKYDLEELKYDTDKLTYSLASYNSKSLKGTTNAIEYTSPRDTALLKSIKFYNRSAPTDIRVHVYQNPLSDGSNPASTSFVIKNFVLNGWVSIDMEDYQFIKDRNSTFDVGIGFLQDESGAMGYQNVSGDSHTDKSFVKGFSSPDVFFNLSDYKVGPSNLTGTWMIRLEIATPYTGEDKKSAASFETVKTYPIPYNPQNQSVFSIEYALDNFGPVNLKIYNILGQLIFSAYDEFGSGTFLWDGKNVLGTPVASGIYIIRLSTTKDKKYKRLLLIR